MTQRFAHFKQRCRERGIVSVTPEKLALELEAAVRDGRSDLVERVYKHNGASVWRFCVPADGIFYAVMTDPGFRVLTVLTKDMLRNYKDIRRGKARSVAQAEAQRDAKSSKHHARWRRRRLEQPWN